MDEFEARVLEEHLTRGRLADLVACYDRSVVVVLRTSAGQEVDRIGVDVSEGRFRIGPAPDPPAAGDLVICVDLAAALDVGNGRSLVEDEFAVGRITLENALPDDYRQAPALELLIEGITQIGIVH
jgi:hypothetical protein